MTRDLRGGATDPAVPRRVVVGADGASASQDAVALAADEAWRRGTSLHVLTVVEPVRGSGLDLSALLRRRGTAWADAEKIRAQAMTAALSRRPGLDVTGVVVPATDDAGADQAVRARAELAGSALLVVGARGGRGVPAFAMGTTSGMLVAVSSCPVLVPAGGAPVRVPASGDGERSTADARPVVACVDARHPVPVLDAAAVEAGTWSLPLLVVHVAAGDETPGEALTWLTDLVRTRVPATTGTEVRIVLGAVVPGLIEVARDCSVLVVGSRGTLALAGLALGSVSHEILRASPVPVLVARATDVRTPRRARQQAGTG